MKSFNFLQGPDINQGIKEYDSIPDAILLDVRTSQEYWEGHIPGSKNIPLHTIDKVISVADKKDVPLFVYCHSGIRSRQAVNMLQHMGYTNVKDLGGICAYLGKVER